MSDNGGNFTLLAGQCNPWRIAARRAFRLTGAEDGVASSALCAGLFSDVTALAVPSGGMGTRDRIEAVLTSIRPAIRSDGGDVELAGWNEELGRVEVRLMGACESCPISMLTLKEGIERRLRAAVPEVQVVDAR